ncbi:MAG: hypothetical protein FJ399_06190 [Verrucomicrobia bacterium]|nr:hypothetical protein [Verrucomicrobiota bacterium]
MNIERIRERVSGGGFKPFRLCLSDGTKIPVPLPELVAIGKNVILAVGEDDRAYTLDPLHIVALEDFRPRPGARLRN